MPYMRAACERCCGSVWRVILLEQVRVLMDSGNYLTPEEIQHSVIKPSGVQRVLAILPLGIIHTSYISSPWHVVQPITKLVSVAVRVCMCCVPQGNLKFESRVGVGSMRTVSSHIALPLFSAVSPSAGKSES